MIAAVTRWILTIFEHICVIASKENKRNDYNRNFTDSIELSPYSHDTVFNTSNTGNAQTSLWNITYAYPDILCV